MSERDALTAAVLADPDDDLPRLVFADWLDERGEPAHARFIRAQIALAALSEWDPQSAALRRTQPEWDCSAELVHTLPQLTSDDGIYGGLHWDRAQPFRRGFAHGIQVPALTALQTRMPALLVEHPLRRLGLYSATLDQWREFAASPWLPRISEIDFEGLGAPIEAMRELLASPGGIGLRALRFGSSVSAGMPIVLERLLRSEVGDNLRTLELASDESYFEDFLEAFQVGGEKLDALKLRSMGFGGNHLHRFLVSRRWENLGELSIVDEKPGATGLSFLSYPDCWPLLRSLKLDGVDVTEKNPGPLANNLRPPRLAVLDIANSLLSPQSFQALAKADHLADLRVVRLRRMNLDNRGARYLAKAKFWRNLVELDLRGNFIDENGAKHLIGRKPPENLELLRIDDRFPEEFRARLCEHFGGKLVLEKVAV